MRSTISTAILAATAAITVQVVALSATASLAVAAPAPQYQTQGTLRPSGGDRALQRIVTRVRTNAETLRAALSGNPVGLGRNRRSPADDIQYAVDDVVTAIDHLSDHSTRNQVVQLDLDDVMRRGANLEAAIDNGASPAVRNAWLALRRDLEAVASAFGQTWDWRNPSYSSSSAASYDDRLSGTYELVPAQSDNPRRMLNQAMRGQRRNAARIRQDFETRLDPPAVISIERTGNEVTLASSDAPRVTFDASGNLINERRGARNQQVRASVYGDRVEVSTNGSGVDDFTATFEPLEDGRQMRLTRQMRSADLTQPVVIRSVYRRTNEQPDWNVFSGPRAVVGTSGNLGGNLGGALEDGTLLTATLDNPVNIRSVRENDRVSLTVHNAPETRLENAILEGYVTSVPNASDTSGFSVVFNRIRLANGRTADFDGTVENVRGPNGESISFEGERIESDDQRDEAIQRGAIGAAIGAVIGAVVGGTKGAAIGAVVGGGGGAASVLIGGQRATDLPRGTQFTIRSRGSSNFNR